MTDYVPLTSEQAKARRVRLVAELRTLADKFRALNKELDVLLDALGNVPSGGEGDDALMFVGDKIDHVIQRVALAASAYESYKPGLDEPEFTKVR